MFDVKIYKKGRVVSKQIKEVEGLSQSEKVWVDVFDFDEEDLKKIKEEFCLHSLTVEDCLRARTRIKLEEYKKYTYIVTKGVILKKKKRCCFEQINLIVGENFLITLCYKKVKSIEKLKNNRKKLLDLFEKGPGVEFVAHSIIDRDVDQFFPYLEKLDERMDYFEEEVFEEDGRRHILKMITSLKKEILGARKMISATREVVRTFSSREVKFFDPSVIIYFRDVQDHLIRLTEILDSHRDLITSTLEVQLAMSTNKTNDIMRILTIITTLLMPLTFITGLYGMNFRFMPEIEWQYGYPMTIAVMILIEIAMLFYFKKKHWI
ncbi:magnesium/cobalt transporter CorA [Patescibacteria group bacterium]|nr:magnesium/cobalt transporter CorA [Patescibacteria group bacterium]